MHIIHKKYIFEAIFEKIFLIKNFYAFTFKNKYKNIIFFKKTFQTHFFCVKGAEIVHIKQFYHQIYIFICNIYKLIINTKWQFIKSILFSSHIKKIYEITLETLKTII